MYTYLIGWSKHNTYYYGARWAKDAHPSDLWNGYYTSSKYVAQFERDHGKPDIIQVRKVFQDANSAHDWESKVMRRLKVVSDPRFLNRWDNNFAAVPKNFDGVRPFTLPEVQEKAARTRMKKYGGFGSGSAILRERVEKTNVARYGSKHTLHTDAVANARIEGSLKKYGVTNPFFSKEFQDSRSNPMHDPVIRARHKEIMAAIDFSGRTDVTKNTNLEKYGVVNPLLRQSVKQSKLDKALPCPFGCKDGYKFIRSSLFGHMTKMHNWTKEQLNEFYKQADSNKRSESGSED